MRAVNAKALSFIIRNPLILSIMDIRDEPGSIKNLGRLWLAYTELQGDFTCYHSYLLTLGTLHSQNKNTL